MTYSRGQLRQGMDVFGSDGGYVGAVIWVRTQRGSNTPEPAQISNDGEQAGATQAAFSGEALGPMPTASIGNTGPRRQTESTAYATARRGDAPTVTVTELVVVRSLIALNWFTLRPRIRRVPISLVQTASHERIILTVPATTLA